MEDAWISVSIYLECIIYEHVLQNKINWADELGYLSLNIKLIEPHFFAQLLSRWGWIL